MATETVATGAANEALNLSVESLEETSVDAAWQSTDLPRAAARHTLARAEKAAQGLFGVSTILLRDLAHEQLADGDGDLEYRRLSAFDRGNLREAQSFLVAEVYNLISSARDELTRG
jgi:hypothetical protein